MLLADMPAEQYHAIEAMSASGSKKMLRSPAHYLLTRTKQGEQTDAMAFGSACHVAVFEAQRFEAAVIVAPDFNRRTKDGRAAAEAFAAEHAGKIILPPDRMDACMRVRDAVHTHPGARALLQNGRPEVSMIWRDGQFGVPCKARADWIRDSDGGIVDLKTTQDASAEAFGRTIANYLYHMQGAHYCSGAEHVVGKTPAFFAFIAVESDEPYAVACYVLETAHLLAGARLMDTALARYRDALATGQWAGYPETIQTAKVPNWALRFDA
jgi:exodeoxyribonuclease VIII